MSKPMTQDTRSTFEETTPSLDNELRERLGDEDWKYTDKPARIESLIQKAREEAEIDARKAGYIDGIASDKRSLQQLALSSTVKALEDVRMYALDCTFGCNFESSRTEKAIPIASIESRISYYSAELKKAKGEKK